MQIMKLDWNSHFDFGDGIASYVRPQADGEREGNQFKPEVVKKKTPHDIHR
jgi:hypothetical protein